MHTAIIEKAITPINLMTDPIDDSVMSGAPLGHHSNFMLIGCNGAPSLPVDRHQETKRSFQVFFTPDHSVATGIESTHYRVFLEWSD